MKLFNCIRYIVVVSGLTIAGLAIAETIEHFEGKSVASLEEAVTHFNRYNQRLENLLKKDTLTAEDVTRIHELTYTLENALSKINEEMDTLAVTLENVHLSSEKYDAKNVQQEGDKYLNGIKAINGLGDS